MFKPNALRVGVKTLNTINHKHNVCKGLKCYKIAKHNVETTWRQHLFISRKECLYRSCARQQYKRSHLRAIVASTIGGKLVSVKEGLLFALCKVTFWFKIISEKS